MKFKLLMTALFTGAFMTFAGVNLTPVQAEGADEAKPEPGANIRTRRAEGDQLLGSMRDVARVEYAKTGAAPKSLVGEDGCGLKESDLRGEYCKVHDKIYMVEDNNNNWEDDKSALIAEDFAGGDGFAILIFVYANGKGSTKWYKTLGDLKKSNEDIDFGDDNEADDEDANDPAVDADDPYALYKKVGRKWKHKSVTTIEGMDDIVSYTEYEVLKVTDDSATLRTTILDKDQEPMAFVDPVETVIEFVQYEGSGEPAEGIPDTERETITVEAGEFECYVTEMAGTKTWMSVKYPGLLVKMKSDTTTMELIEFSENGDADEDADEAEPEDEGEPLDQDEFWKNYVATYKKGRSWTYELKGGMEMTTKVTMVADDSATTTITTRMNGKIVGQPTRTDVPLKKPDVEPEQPDADKRKWKTKEVTVKAGTFECISHDGETWLMKKYPVIIVKMTGIELVDFDE